MFGPIFRSQKGNKKALEASQEDNGDTQAFADIPPLFDSDPNLYSLGWYENTEGQIQVPKITQEDRLSHFYIIGGTGTGKSKYMEFLTFQDIEENGMGIIDPHGDLIEATKLRIAAQIVCSGNEEYFDRVVVVDPLNSQGTVTFNPLEKLDNIPVDEQALDLVEAFKKIWSDSWGSRMEDLLRNCFVVLIENGLTLLELLWLMTDEPFRKKALEKVQNPIAQHYFRERFSSWNPRTRNEWMESTLNKVNSFLTDERIRLFLSSPTSSFNLREVMDNRKILLINLNKGKLKSGADLLGSLLLSKLKMAAFSRTDIPLSERVPFFLYVDEFQNFASDDFAEILSEARKFRLILIMAHQNMSQLTRNLRGGILGNVGIQVYFRVSREDAEILAKEAFETTGTEVKSVRYGDESFSFDYYAYSEEWEKHIRSLQRFENRQCLIYHKMQGGLIKVTTPNVPCPRHDAEMKEAELHSIAEGLGKSYLQDKRQLEEGWQARKNMLIGNDRKNYGPTSFRE